MLNFFFYFHLCKVIGYPSNSKTWTAIRVYTASDDLKKEETPHILKPNAPNHVIISITEGKYSIC